MIVSFETFAVRARSQIFIPANSRFLLIVMPIVMVF
ncbi:hypothetical protein [Caudoviricetes sp.]|nr:hypothetical protein [Caudoviricetes sp.]